MSLGTIFAEGFEISTEHTSQWMKDNQELIEGTLTDLFEFGGECASLAGKIVENLVALLQTGGSLREAVPLETL